ncbi:MAG: formylglycine-generating enzyme family protein, partial [Isosphaeraceae bacterium]
LRSGVPAQDRITPRTGPVETPARGTFRPGEAREASSSAECPGGSVSPGRPAPVSSPAHWGARPEVHARRAATAMSDRGRKVLVVSLAGLSLVIVLGLGALGVFAPVGRPRGTPGPTLVAPPSDTRPGGPVTSATLVKAEGRAIRKGQVVFDGDAPTAPPSQEPQPQRPQPQPRRDWTNSIGMKLARIEPGSFLMGSTDGTGDEDEHPQHEVRITRPFYLGVTEVTQAQYEAVMDGNPSWFASTGQGKDKVAGQSTSQHPVENVSWLDAVKFCNKLSEMEGRKPFYEINEGTVRVPDWKASGYRLPTEAEWEYACGGDPADLNEHAWFEGNSGSVTHPVGKKLTNRFGLHDMPGNVWEWCWDAYDKDYYKQSPPDDPPGPSQAADRVLRGGCWSDYPRNCRSANRYGFTPDDRNFDLGFRLAAVQE